MRHLARLTLPFALSAMLAGGAGATALEPLGQNKYVTDRLVAARVADRIRKACPEEIGARMVYALGQAQALKGWAEGQGYPGEEIRRFLKDKSEKRVIYARAGEYLAANGATEGNVAGFCALGRKEIAAGSIAGSLMYRK